jgi:hypothetical protein
LALLLRGRDNTTTAPEMVTIELFPRRDGKENIVALRMIASKGFHYAWTINKKVRVERSCHTGIMLTLTSLLMVLLAESA